MVHITLINAMTFNLTLLQVNHVTLDNSDLHLILRCSRQKSQTGIKKSRPQGAFVSMDMHVRLGKSRCCEINFLSLIVVVNFIK